MQQNPSGDLSLLCHAMERLFAIFRLQSLFCSLGVAGATVRAFQTFGVATDDRKRRKVIDALPQELG